MAKKPDFWEYPLGADADVNSLAIDPDNSKGDVTLRGLFPVLTSTRLKDGGIPPQRKDINALFKLIGENIYFLQRGGQYEWSDSITYDENAVVMRGSTFYRAKQASEGDDPLTNPGIWEKVVQVTASDLDALRRELPQDATTETKGVTRLSDEISVDNSSAITPRAVNEFKDEFENLKDDYESFKTTVDGLSGGSVELTDRVAALEEGLRSNDAKDGGQDKRLESLENSVHAVNDRIDSINSFNPSEINQNIQTINDDLSGLHGSVDNLDERVANVVTRTENFESNVNNINDTLDGLNTRALNHDTSLAQHTEKLENIDKELENIAGVFDFKATDEYDAGNVVLFENELYICQAQITKPGRPADPKEGDDLEEYKRQKEAWENAETGISINDRSYWLPASKGTKYESGITYDKGDLVVHNHKIFECLQETRDNVPQDGSIWKEITQQPSLGIFAWDETTTFKAGQVVLVDKVLYKCVKANIGNNPSLDSANNNANWIALNTSSGNTGSSADLDSLSTIIASLPTAGIFNYSSDKEYSKNQVVRYGNNLWLAQETTSDVPVENSSWIKLSKIQAEDVRDVFADVITYNASTKYKVNDVVQYGDYLWRATAANQGTAPADGSVWKRLCATSAEDPAFKALKARVDENDNLDNQQQTRLSTLESKTASLENTVGDLDLSSVNEQIQTAIDTADGLKTRVNNLETDSGNKKTQIEALQNDVSDLKLHDTAVQTTLDGLRSDVDGLKNAGIDGIKSDISDLKAEDVSIKSRLKTLEDTATGGVDLSTVQQDIENLQSDMSNLQKIDHSQYALKSEIPAAQDLSAYAKTADVAATYAKKSDIPEAQDLSAYAKKTDLNDYAKKTDIPEVPDLTEYAKKSDIPEIDTSTLATKSSVDTLSTQVQKNTTDIANLKKNSGSSGSSGSGQNIGIYALTNPEEDTDQYFITITYKGEEGACTGVKATTTRSDPVEIYLDSSKRLDSMSIHVTGNITSMLQDNGKLIKSFMLKYSDGRTQTSYEEWDSAGDNLLTQAQGLRAFPAIYFQHASPAATQYSDWATDQGKVYFWSSGDEIVMRADASASDTKKSQFGNYTDVNFIIKLNF